MDAKKKILIVDDDVELAKFIKMRLEANGYETVTAADGVEGLEKAENEKPDLILLDIKMAKLNGYTMFHVLKHKDNTKAIPVVILTAYKYLKSLFDFEDIQDFIVKPFEDQDLLLRIARALKKRG